MAINNLTQKKFLQHLRSQILTSREDAINALKAIEVSLKEKPNSDGAIVLSRYKENDVVKSLIGVFATGSTSNEGHMTIYSQSDNEFQALENKLNNEITARKAVTGINGDAYVQHTSDTVISGATSLDNADVLLADAIRAEETRATAAEAKAKTEVKEGTDNSHLEIKQSIDEGGDKHTIYTVTLTDVASDSALTQEVTDRKAKDDAIISGAGLTQTDGTYSANTTTKYIKDATSLKDADDKLDTAIKGVRTDLGESGDTSGKTTAFGRIKKVEETLEGLDYTDSGYTDGQYVTKVTETNGLIEVSRAQLVNNTDSVLSYTNEGIKSAIQIIKVTDSNLQANIKDQYKLVGKDNQQLGDAINVYKDSAISEVKLGKDDATIDENGKLIEPTPSTASTGNDALLIVYHKEDGKYELVKIPVADFLRESEFKDGLQVLDGVVSVLKDPASDDFLTVTDKGVKVSGIKDAIDTAKTTVSKKDDVNTNAHLEVVGKPVTEGDKHTNYELALKDVASESGLTAEVTRATGAETAETDARKAVTGIEGDTYVQHTSDTVISEATSLDNADVLLASAVKAAQDDINTINGDENKEGSIKNAVKAEKTRATAAENEINKNIGTKEDASSASTVYGAIKAEEERAKAAETANTKSINDETAARKTVTGVDGDACSYSGTNYLDGVYSLHAADVALDAKVKANADAIANNLTGLTSEDKAVDNEVVTQVNQSQGKVRTSNRIKLLDTTSDNAITNTSGQGLYLSNIWDCGTFEL